VEEMLAELRRLKRAREVLRAPDTRQLEISKHEPSTAGEPDTYPTATRRFDRANPTPQPNYTRITCGDCGWDVWEREPDAGSGLCGACRAGRPVRHRRDHAVRERQSQ